MKGCPGRGSSSGAPIEPTETNSVATVPRIPHTIHPSAAPDGGKIPAGGHSLTPRTAPSQRGGGVLFFLSVASNMDANPWWSGSVEGWGRWGWGVAWCVCVWGGGGAQGAPCSFCLDWGSAGCQLVRPGPLPSGLIN